MLTTDPPDLQIDSSRSLTGSVQRKHAHPRPRDLQLRVSMGDQPAEPTPSRLDTQCLA